MLTAKRIIPFIVSLAFFMESMDSTIINTSIPVISASLHVDPLNLKVALISYLLSLAVFIPISGWCADKFGAKKVFIAALSVFTLSSLGCGFSHTLEQMVVMRLLQGLGGALGLPVGRLIILRTFSRTDFIATSSQVVMVGALGMMLGPLLGGLITHYFSWPWIFWINVPVGLFTIILSIHCLSEAKSAAVPPLDKLGFILFGTALAGLTFGLSALSEKQLGSMQGIGIIIGAVILLLLYWWHSLRQPYPIVKTALLHVATFRTAALGSMFSRMSLGGIPFLVPLLLQIGLGYSPPLSGLLLMPVAIGVIVVKPLSLVMLRLFGFKRLLITNTLLAGVFLWTFMLVTIHTPLYLIAVFTFFFGFFASLQYSAIVSLAYADLTDENQSAATSIMSTIQQIAQSFGVAISALLVRVFANLTGNGLTPTIFHYAFFGIGLIAFLPIIFFVGLNSESGYQMLNRRKK